MHTEHPTYTDRLHAEHNGCSDVSSLDVHAEPCELCHGSGRVELSEGEYVPARMVADGGGATRRGGMPCPECAARVDALVAAECGPVIHLVTDAHTPSRTERLAVCFAAVCVPAFPGRTWLHGQTRDGLPYASGTKDRTDVTCPECRRVLAGGAS